MTKKTEKPWGPAEVESSNTGKPRVAAEAGTGADKQDKMTDISVVRPGDTH
jgi:hypothetical protein